LPLNNKAYFTFHLQPVKWAGKRGGFMDKNKPKPMSIFYSLAKKEMNYQLLSREQATQILNNILLFLRAKKR